jgi:hypothetical protein
MANIKLNLDSIKQDINNILNTNRTNYEIIYTKNENLRLIKCSFRYLIHYTQNWIYNRSLSNLKVEELHEDIKTNSNKNAWTLYAFRDLSNNEIKILDGQHRREAIKKYLETNDTDMMNNDEILIWLYDIPNEELNEDKIIDLFIKLNKNEPIDVTQLPSKRKIKLFHLIVNDSAFKSAIRASENTNEARSPYISKKQVKNMIDLIINRYSQLTNDEILLKMKEMNRKISMMAIMENVEEQLFRRQLKKKEKEIIEECFEIKFYLNIKNSIYDNFKWIEELI